MKTTFEMLGVSLFGESLAGAEAFLVQDLQAQVRSTAQAVKADAQLIAPVFTGTLKSRIRVRASRGGLRATVVAAAPHSWIIGRGGRKPGKMPPTDKLAIWALAKGLAGKEYIIARSIARKGIKPKRFLDTAWRNRRPGFIAGVQETLRRFTDAINQR